MTFVIRMFELNSRECRSDGFELMTSIGYNLELLIFRTMKNAAFHFSSIFNVGLLEHRGWYCGERRCC